MNTKMYVISWKIFFRLMVMQFVVCTITASYIKIKSAKMVSAVLADLTEHDLESAVEVARDQVEKLATFERNINLSGLKTEKESPFYGLMVDFMASEEALNNTRNALIAIKASQYLVSKYCLRASGKNRVQCVRLLNSMKLPGELGEACARIYGDADCEIDSEYRTADGGCNNMRSLWWGRSNTGYRRLIQPNYEDGVLSIRKSLDFPSPRAVSTAISETKKMIDYGKTQAMSTWGLFVSHDMIHTPASNMVNIQTPITCCTSDGGPLPPRYNHISCAPILIPQTDIFYSKFSQTCMNYVRSLPALRSECTFGPTEQMNQATHFLDGSVIYGSTERKMRSLRAMWGGRLLTSVTKDGEEYPPTSDSSETPCHLTNVSECFHAGDVRINSQPQLNVLHTLFVREHNRIADRLSAINRNWDDEQLYQESRKIVIAEIQHITYNHWLPRILGKKFVRSRGLDSSLLMYSYDEKLNPTVSNSFAVAGLPFVNSMIDGSIGLYREDRNVTEVADLKQYFVKDSLRINQTTYLDSMVRGLATQNSHKIDNTFEDALTHYLYSPSGKFGMDLLSIDIQRGRDHGIPSYTQFRQYCNLSEVSTFKDLRGIITETTIDRLESVYQKVTDIDLFVGAVSELPVKDAMVGPTLQCILAEQFLRTRYGDRFFYDNPFHVGSFSKKQLEQIKQVNLARILCDNSNEVKRMQTDVFLVPDNNWNRLLNCAGTGIASIDLSAWRDEFDDS